VSKILVVNLSDDQSQMRLTNLEQNEQCSDWWKKI